MAQFDTQMLEKKCEDVSALLKSLAHPTRLQILCSLVEGPQAVGQLVSSVGISQSLMSQFLKRMKEEGLLSSQRDGKSIYYQIHNKDVFKLLKSLKNIFC